MLARGGYEVAIAWKDGKPQKTVISAAKNGECKLYQNSNHGTITITANGENVEYTTAQEDGLTLIVFYTAEGTDYEILYH